MIKVSIMNANTYARRNGIVIDSLPGSMPLLEIREGYCAGT